MYYRVIRRDIKKSKTITLAITLFVTAASLLVALAAILIVNLTGAIDTLMIQSKTPHLTQMHAGEVNHARLSAFAEQNKAVEDFQVVEFLNVDGGLFDFSNGSLSGSVQDNGLSVQSEKFDFLLDLNGEVITVSEGEIYVPLTYLQSGIARVGGTVAVAGKTFIIAGPLRDSQMQPLLSSSKRFLVNRNDFETLKQFGRLEYLIEFRLHDLADLGAFQAAYTKAGLESNGPTLTYPLFRMFNALSDGLMIAVILMISVLVIVIAFLCIRFTLLARIEDDYREIGVMKALGLRVADIKKIYLTKYLALAAAGSLFGYGLSFVFRDTLLANIRLYMGESENRSLAMLLGILGVFLVFLTIGIYVNSVLGRFRNISPAQAIRFGISAGKAGGAKHLCVNKNRLISTNVFLGIKDVLARRGLYVTMLTVMVLAVFIIVVPKNLHNTISSKSFITYMGVGESDFRIDIQQTDHIAAKAQEIATAMEKDTAFSRFVVLTTKTFQVKTEEGPEELIKVELGDPSIFPLTYIQGHAPTSENEIALSVLNSKELGKKTGDVLTLIINNNPVLFTICGIYSDVTHGGKSAKAVFSAPSGEIMWSVITAELSDPTLVAGKVAEYTGRFPYAKVSDIDEFILQTYGGTIRAIGKAVYIATGIALTITLLITLLFMRMLVAKDRYSIAVMKAFGFTNSDIRIQYAARSIFILALGLLIGTLLAQTLGGMLAGAVIASFGAASFKLIINPVSVYLLCPLIMTVVVLAATIIGTQHTGRITISENIKE